VADNAYGVFVNSDNDTADFENFNETAHGRNRSRDDDSGKAYWGDGWATFFNDEFQGKNIFLLKVTVPDSKRIQMIIRYFSFFSPVKTRKYFGY
jgi:hypothetical protein